jgi:prepilin-type N-terminal cleavage/methylation domain-containing protein
MIPFARRNPRYAAGFTLVEIAVVLVILAIVIAMAALLTRGIAAGQKRSLTTTRLAGIDAAVVQFVMQQKRLPCPANGTVASTGVNPGLEARGAPGLCTNNQQDGVVPWAALGLAEADVTDGWERRLTYRVDPALTADNAMDMSACDPAGTGLAAAGNTCLISPPAAAPCTSAALGNCTPPSAFLIGKGLRIQNVVGGAVMARPAGPNPPLPGAAYVAISAGESGGGAYLNSGQLSVTTTTDGTEERQQNYASLPLGLYYVDDGISDVPGPSHFDDIVSRPSVMSVISKAGLAPRSH